MAEYIERDKILERMDLVVIYARGVSGDDPISKNITDIVAGMRDIVAMAPAADVAPVVHGRWMNDGMGDMLTIWKCSLCGYRQQGAFMRYCPNCGARMDGGNEDGNN